MYLATTKADRLPTDHQIIMVDGTVPDWEAKPGDLHWDHHRPGGANVQMDEIPAPQKASLLEEQSSDRPPALSQLWWMRMPAVQQLGCSCRMKC